MRRYLRWLLPGLGLKRWLFTSFAGVFLIGLSISLAVRENLYARVELWLLEHITYTREVFIWGPVGAGALLFVIGLALMLLGVIRLVQAVLQTLASPSESVAEAYYQRRFLGRGPKVVALGGGTGIPTLLRGLKAYSSNLTAVVTVADDGGSSGRLRTEFGILPPGDIRNCLVALADTEPLMERLFQYRFPEGSGLAGHPFGNLFILAMSEITGNFYDAVQASSQILAIQGRVMPATLDHVILKAELKTGEIMMGESQIGKSPQPIKRVFLERLSPREGGAAGVQPLPDALEAVAQADVIVLGPGSLYTSVIPNLLVPGMADAIRASAALKIYICNVMTQPGETDHYTVSQHIKALVDHAGEGIVDICLANNYPVSPQLRQKYLEQNAIPIPVDVKEAQRMGVEIVQGDLLDIHREFVRHDPDKLARLIGRLFLNRRMTPERTPWEYFLFRQRLQTRRREARR